MKLSYILSFLLLSVCFVFSPQSHSRRGGAPQYHFQEPGSLKPNPIFAEVDRLKGEQKYQEALTKAQDMYAEAKRKKDAQMITESLIRVTELMVGLHKVEEAVTVFRGEPKPTSLDAAVLLEIYYGSLLSIYFNTYNWEIQGREKISSTEKDIKTWTTAQISAEVLKAHANALQNESILNQKLPAFYRYYVIKNTYPDDVRPTLRDFVVYSAVNHLADSSFWSARESNEASGLPFAKLMTSPSTAVALMDSQQHPLSKMAALLIAHKEFHQKNNRPGAALEAQYVLHQKLFQHASQKQDRELLIQSLAQLQNEKNSKKHVWWAAGQALWAQQLMEITEDEDRFIRALEVINNALQAYPDSFGAKKCMHFKSDILRPHFEFQTMSHDGENKRSLQVVYKNIPKLYFRAYPLNLKKEIETAPAGELWGHHLNEKWKSETLGEPVAQWEQNLPPTKDYLSHTVHLKPQLSKKGAYLIVASLQKSFTEQAGNQVQGVPFLLTHLVLQRWALSSGKIEIRAVSGESGLPVEGATISNWARNENAGWNKPAVQKASQVSNAAGFVEFAKAQNVYEYFQFATKGEDMAYLGKTWSSDERNSYMRRIMIFTDRRIFRPQQKIYWKVLNFHGDAQKGDYNVDSKQKLIVELLDANRKVIAKQNVTTNGFGTASGEFIAEKDKALGEWQINVRLGNDVFAGSTSIRVEEYKRPTFEVDIKDAGQGLRLNQKASFVGDVRYYFGQAVTAGSVKWRVERNPEWSWWWYGSRDARLETIATGTTKVANDGSFKVEFVAKGDERERTNNPGIRYRFSIHADVTDDGGETRSGSKNFYLGFVSIDARISEKVNYFKEKEPIDFSVVLMNLDGKEKSGKGDWQIVKVIQPEKPFTPAELPSDAARGPIRKHSLAGDHERPRWDTRYNVAEVVREWANGAIVTQGTLQHAAKGEGEIRVSEGLTSGLYRLIYKSKDEFGAELKVAKEFFVIGDRFNMSLPLLVRSKKATYDVGETANIVIGSGFQDQDLFAEVYVGGIRQKKMIVKGFQVISVPITEKERGGLSILVSGVRDYQLLQEHQTITVPWSNKELKIETATFRDKIRPGSKEAVRITVASSKGKALPAKAAEILAFMYDRSLDFFVPHTLNSLLSAYPDRAGIPRLDANVFANYATAYTQSTDYVSAPSEPEGDVIALSRAYGVGGPGYGQSITLYADSSSEGDAELATQSRAFAPAPAMAKLTAKDTSDKKGVDLEKTNAPSKTDEPPPMAVRSDFSETAFWKPHLLTGADGSISFEFQVPDSLTSWNFWANAITPDVRSGVLNARAQSVKELMVRPYLPRFLREGDEAELKIMVNNGGSVGADGALTVAIEDLETGKNALADFGLDAAKAQQRFSIKKDGSQTLKFSLKAPKTVRTYAITVKAQSKNFSDGEKRLLPVLPSRMHLAQSRFVTLRNKDQKTMEFPELAKGDDASLITDRLVLTVDAQLFYGVLQSLPYLITYPYDCAEQTLNRFVSTGIVNEVFKKYPSVQKMAQEFSKRKTPLESFNGEDANRRMTFEESPWLLLSEGGVKAENQTMANILDSRIVLAEKDKALKKLKKMQTSDGGFPWFEGGRPDEYMTLYILLGLSRANEFHIEIPKDVVVRAWKFMKNWSNDHLNKCMAAGGCYEFVTLVNFALTSYPDESWTGGVFSKEDKKKFLEYGFSSWKKHSPLLKGYLALTLKRMDRYKDAQLVWASVMDAAKSTEELGTYWAPEERSWLWYNDTIETHAFALRVQMEMAPADKKNDGLVQWLFLNKKLNHWKSTKATAESIYSLVHYLEKEKSLGAREEITASIGGQNKKFEFDPKKYTGKKNQIVVSGAQIQPARDAKITVSKSTPGFAFASSTWHFSTEKVPEKGDGDMFSVSRKYFVRELKGKEWTLKPLVPGGAIKVGDQIEVQISLRAKHAAEYVHLRDPRGAGFEPEEQVSQYRYDLGLYYYQEVRDSGGNFFFNRLPVGQYTFKYRLRANMAGTFRVGPATVQSLYAPEFNAYSQGNVVSVGLSTK